MAVTVVNIGGKSNVPIFDIRVDTENDIASIDTKNIPHGSTVFIIDTGAVKMLNSKKEWVEI